jgi:hypothetical protein
VQRLIQTWNHDKLTILNVVLVVAILTFLYFVVLP